MSIFKETLPDFVYKQLRIREAIMEQGNNPQGINAPRFGNPRKDIKIKNNTEKIAIDAGAFYTNTVYKQCVIKMMSGVDIIDKNLLETGESIESDNLAKKFILKGGVTTTDTYPSFSKQGGAYGNSSTRSDAKDGFGIVPMPGIIDAEIRTKSAYGSLREAKVNFVCHNRRQLDALEMLYMRPGMPVLLEWQWSPFIDNDGKINNMDYSLGSAWFNSNNTISNFNNSIIDNKQRSGGNYDGFVGFCKNFEITSRPDGGYNCTTELIASGEILESLKSRRDGYTKTSTTEKLSGNYTDEDIKAGLSTIDNMELILEGILELSKLNSRNGIASNFDITPDDNRLGGFQKKQKIQSRIYGPKGSPSEILINLLTDKKENEETTLELLKEQFGDYQIDNISKQSPEDLEKLISISDNGAINNFLQSDDIYDSDFLWQGESLGGDSTILWGLIRTGFTINKYNTYMSWKVLCNLVNKLVFPTPNLDGTKEPLLKLVTYYHSKTPEGEKPETLKIIPYNFPTNRFTFGKKNFGSILDNSFDPSVCLMPWQNKDIAESNKFEIRKILLNVEYMLTKYRQMAYSGDNMPVEDFNLFDFFNSIWSDVNQACAGHHNFILQTDMERTNHVRVIDFSIETTNETIKPTDLFEFQIQSNKSIVRDFNFNTTIPNSLSATIAIAAQAPSSVSDLDQVTFANFSKGIRSRFHKPINPAPLTKAESDEQKNKEKTAADTALTNYKKDLKILSVSAQTLMKYMEQIYGDESNFSKEKNEVDGATYQEVISLAKSTEALLYSLLGRNKKGEKIPITAMPRSAVIPLKFNCQLDGIGGIVIGNLFKVEKEKLPKGYQSDQIAFAVLGESQKITSGQDWTTEISGQLLLLDLSSETETEVEESSYNITTTPINWIKSINISSTPTNVPLDILEQLQMQGEDPAPIINPNKVGFELYNTSPVAKFYKGKKEINGKLDESKLKDLGIARTGTTKNYRLHPAAAEAWFRWKQELENKGIEYRITSAYRNQDDQSALSNPPKKGAAAAGSSPHGWGGALDFGHLYQLVGGSSNPKENKKIRIIKPQYKQIAEIGVKHGWYNPWRLSDGEGEVDEIWHFEYWGPTNL